MKTLSHVLARAGDKAGIFAAALAVLSAFSPAAAQQALTTNQRAALGPAAADQAARQDLLSVLQHVDAMKPGIFIQLHDLDLTTRPYGTDFVGLCRQDTLVLQYAPTDIAPQPRNEPVRPYGFESEAWFHVVHAPASSTGRNVWDTDCAGLAQNHNVIWFTAPDAFSAARAANFLASATKAVADGALKPETCTLPPIGKRTCEEIVADAGDMANIDYVRTCPAENGAVCYVVDVAGYISLTITGHMDPANDLAPAKIDSIAAAAFITVT